MNNDKKQSEPETLLELMERGRRITKRREEERAKRAKAAKLIELVVFCILLAALIFSALFWR
jgi:hypothetical protein